MIAYPLFREHAPSRGTRVTAREDARVNHRRYRGDIAIRRRKRSRCTLIYRANSRACLTPRAIYSTIFFRLCLADRSVDEQQACRLRHTRAFHHACTLPISYVRTYDDLLRDPFANVCLDTRGVPDFCRARILSRFTNPRSSDRRVCPPFPKNA